MLLSLLPIPLGTFDLSFGFGGFLRAYTLYTNVLVSDTVSVLLTTEAALSCNPSHCNPFRTHYAFMQHNPHLSLKSSVLHWYCPRSCTVNCLGVCPEYGVQAFLIDTELCNAFFGDLVPITCVGGRGRCCGWGGAEDQARVAERLDGRAHYKPN